MTKTKKTRPSPEANAYEKWRKKLWADPKFRQIYAEEAVKSDLWIQLVTARRDTGLTQAEMAKKLGVSQAQVARIEKDGYDAYTLNTLRKYVTALGEGFSLEVRINFPFATA